MQTTTNTPQSQTPTPTFGAPFRSVPYGSSQQFFTIQTSFSSSSSSSSQQLPQPSQSPRMLQNVHSGSPASMNQSPPHLSIVAVLQQQQQQQNVVEVLGPVTNELSLSFHHSHNHNHNHCHHNHQHDHQHTQSKSRQAVALTTTTTTTTATLEKKRRTPTIKSSRSKNFPSVCGNSKCGTTQTPLWRKGWITPEGRAVMLCNACGLHYKKGHYCPHCNQIYKESDADETTNPWIGCDRCSRWVHRNCAVEFHELPPEALTSPDVPYLCSECKGLKKTTSCSSSSSSPFADSATEHSHPRKTPKKLKQSKSSLPKKSKKRPIDNLASSIDAFRDDYAQEVSNSDDSESSGLSPALSSSSSDPSFPETGTLTPTSPSLLSENDEDSDPSVSAIRSPLSPYKRKRISQSSADLLLSPTSPDAKPLIDIDLKHAKSLLSKKKDSQSKNNKMGWLWAVCEWELQTMMIQ